ncbi:Clp protease ClpP [Mucilaginibacter robiniae]|uniref:ATP-dependent Clp protease proteolytic subunit n=1 Tax=Mucilaginibacter robiniae TaxID=2728022 RepID=A0A7L5DVP1_9SPHI|nr:head maturation protease, ClpP-related [Mucilaginibacter robiniae]QJD95160.1 Clp protease ClpP [Mucilaginibacter robiniae]
MPYPIYLYDTDQDAIGSGSLSSASIRQQLEAAGGQDVELHISSAGGSAFDAIAIYDLLKKYTGHVTTYIDALAASAASIVAMGGHTIVMSKYALLMIHKPLVDSGGNADELLKDIQMLNTVQSRLAQIYIDKTGLDEVTIHSLINAVTWMTADQALALGFIDQIEDYQATVTNSAQLKKCTSTAPAVYQRCINKILISPHNSPQQAMNMHNTDLIQKTTTVLDKMMNFFKKVMNKQTMTDKGPIHHTGDLDAGTEVYQDEDMTEPAVDDVYTTADGQQLTTQAGKVQTVAPAKLAAEDDDEDMPESKLKGKVKSHEVKNSIAALRAKIHAQNALLNEARTALETANAHLKQTRHEIKNEIKSTFTPEGSKRSNKAKAEAQPFFAPQSDLAKNAVKHAVHGKK